jgi:zinc transporter 1
MFFLTGSFFFVELIWGMLIGSLSLLADAMHMLSDLIALGIGMYAVRATKKRRTDVMTFGWTRMEEVGGLMNGVFLLALCLMLVLESLQRLGEMLSNDAQSTIESLSQGGLKVTIIAVVGLVFNLIGMYIFGERGHQHKEHAHKPHGHSHSHSHSHVSEQHPTTSQSNCHADDHEGHSHDDHSHGHDGHSHEHDGHAEDASGDASCDHAGHAHAASHDGHGHSHHEHSHHAHSHHSPDEHDCHAHDEHSHDGHSHDGHSHDGHSHDGHSHDGHSHDEHDEHDAEEEEEEESHGHSHANMNVQAVFLHLLGDALGSVAVLITGLVIQFGGESEYKYLADPICSLCITLFIAYTSMPLVKRAALGLLQPVPAGINLNELKASLMAVRLFCFFPKSE